MLKRNIHSIINSLNKVVDVKTPEKLIKIILKYRNTPIYQIDTNKEFSYGVIHKEVENEIVALMFKPDIKRTCYTFGVNIYIENVIEERSLAAVYLDSLWITLFDREDCKKLFEYVDDNKLNYSKEQRILKKIEKDFLK